MAALGAASSVGRIMRGKTSWPYYYAGVRSAGGPAKGTVGLTLVDEIYAGRMHSIGRRCTFRIES